MMRAGTIRSEADLLDAYRQAGSDEDRRQVLRDGCPVWLGVDWVDQETLFR